MYKILDLKRVFSTFQETVWSLIQTNIWILNPPILYNINDHKLSIPCWHIYTMFRKPKDKLDRDHTTHIVYKIKCRDCTAVYIGQTTRSLKTRIKNIVARHRYLGQRMDKKQKMHDAYKHFNAGTIRLGDRSGYSKFYRLCIILYNTGFDAHKSAKISTFSLDHSTAMLSFDAYAS